MRLATTRSRGGDAPCRRYELFVSAALKANSVPFLVLRWVDQHDGLLKSTATERELLDVLQRPTLAALTDPSFRPGLERLLAAAEPVIIGERIVASRDPKDDKFLELAVAGRADLIVSGDQDLLALSPFRGISIVTPAAFVRGIVT